MDWIISKGRKSWRTRGNIMLRGLLQASQSFRITDRNNRPVERDKFESINNTFDYDIIISDSFSRR